MKDTLVAIRDAINGTVYRRILKPVFFRFDPETVHDRMTAVGVALGRHRLTRWATSVMFGYADPALEQTVAGIRFANPIGLAAGFDKDARLVDSMGPVGFGFEEVGSITGNACAGNPKPRLWRLKRSKGLVVYYGLKNKGCAAIAKHLQGRRFAIPIGTSVAMTNDATTGTIEAGIADYTKAFSAFTEIGAYYTINISCPNTCMGEPFVGPEALERLLARLDGIATKKPVFIKLPADLDFDAVDNIVEVCMRHRVNGFICTNLTKKRGTDAIMDADVPEKGGISGRPVRDLSDAMIAHLFAATKGRFAIIGCGGVFSAEDAYRKIRLGASLVQMITGMIFEGPQVIGEINRGLVRLMKRDGYTNIAQAIGSAPVPGVPSRDK